MKIRKWTYILVLLLFLCFLYYAWSVFMDHAKHERKGHNNIAFVMQLEGNDSNRIVYIFKNCIASICQHSSIGLAIHMFANSRGKGESKKILEEIAAKCLNGLEVKFYDIKEVINKVLPTINVIKDASAVDGHKNTRKPLYYLPIFMDRILSEDVTRVILLDADFFFNTDIKQLFDQFDNFKETTIFGLALVQQPTYRLGFKRYREEHPGTKIGDPPPDGVTGYNGGLSMLHLTNMRRSKLYKRILLNNAVKEYAEKYQFRGTRAEQDFFVLLDAEHHDELFYVVPCQWNRQLCHFDAGFNTIVYNSYHQCSKPIYAYHGNCHSKMPTMDDPYQFQE